MDGTQPGEAGVLAWCNSIRFTLAKDPAREWLDTQIQKQGFDFLDSYLESVLSREKEEPMYELLKTPGKRKDAPKRTRAATAAVAKLKAINSMILEEMEAGPSTQHPRAATATSLPSHVSDTPSEDPFAVVAAPFKPKQKVVTVADSPEKMEVDDQPLQTVQEEDVPMSPSPPPRTLPVSHAPMRSDSVEVETTHRSTIEDKAQRNTEVSRPQSRIEVNIAEPVQSPPALSEQPTAEDTPAPTIVHHGSAKELSMIAEDEEPGEQSRLSPVRLEVDPIPEQDEDDAVPIRDVTVEPMDQDVAVPLRDEPGPPLKRKASVTQFSGLPVPSPLRKSMRMSHDPMAHTPGAGLGKRTSWLTKAKEAKALELTGPGRRIGSRGESAEPAGMLVPGAATDPKKTAQEIPASESGALAFLRHKRNASSLESATGQTQQPVPQPQAQPSAQTHLQPQAAPIPLAPSHSNYYDALDEITVPLKDHETEEHTLHRLKKTVEGARAGKGVKSLGGNAAAELAQARKAAEARVAQRNKTEEPEQPSEPSTKAEATPNVEEPARPARRSAESTKPARAASPPPTEDPSRRMSLSDLMTDFDKAQAAKKPSPPGAVRKQSTADISTTTTPPNSPPPILNITKPPSAQANPSVFSKPPTVFKAPPKQQSSKPSSQPPRKSPPAAAAAAPAGKDSVFKENTFKLPVANPFSLPAAVTLGVPARLPSPDAAPAPKAAAAWLRAQEAEDRAAQRDGQPDDSDDDMFEDSWQADAAPSAPPAWTPFGAPAPQQEQDDTATWDSAPSQRGGAGASGSLGLDSPAGPEVRVEAKDVEELDSDVDKARGEIDEGDLQTDDMDVDDEYVGGADADFDEIVASGQPTVTLVKQPARAPSAQSMASTSSSQSQLGVWGQATRFVSSVLGGSKAQKGKPEPVKSLARAAAAARKQQEEAEKKATRLKEMEARRQQAQQRKAEEEKARVQEEERKVREEAERRKREREEHTDKRPLRSTKKAEEEATQKRKLNVEADKKAGSSKPPSKDAQPARTIKPPSASTNAPPTGGKTGAPLKSALAKKASTQSLAAAASSSAIPKAAESKTSKMPASSSNPKLAGKGKGKAADSDEPQPAKVVQSQMANRAKAQMAAQQTPKAAPAVTSESIELPDINSEYSNSDDEDRPRYGAPEWAQSPELRQQLEQQSRMNPDDIFGPIGPLRMEEIFRTRQSRFRARTSSANWAGPDELTEQEERDYARRMGFE
ncbi:hypothetical protein PsYK624_117920 [Phanerochaete sordida]|uniref:Inner centromere protein ARK-binding domain-containing protein n=1 Tax=Phanerochaete sordida TaxID=48140 RepID=A0A9P3LHJ6_9APHY|nr:hypothetical protein PsYK624_117920 [Phanerochaete sordida]